jgi:hypothetical protein
MLFGELLTQGTREGVAKIPEIYAGQKHVVIMMPSRKI